MCHSRIGLKAALRNYINHCSYSSRSASVFEQYARSPYNEGDNEAIIAEEDKALKPLYELIETGQKEALIKNFSSHLIIMMLCGAVGELSCQVHNLKDER
jgi:hypothetical protein